jgi:prephenate dehydrogenase
LKQQDSPPPAGFFNTARQDMSIQTVGIIGLGSFGRFMATLLPKDVKIYGYDGALTSEVPDVEMADLSVVVSSDVVILAVPLDSYATVLERIKPILNPETLLVDICSVKVKSAALLAQVVPGHTNLLVTHPLFGPQSAGKGTKGHTLIVTHSSGKRADSVLTYAELALGLNVQHMSNEAHDRAMAEVHVLTFFTARALSNTNIGHAPFQTPSFQMLLDLVAFDKKHSEELFQTIQNGNPFADEVRQKLVASFQSLEKELSAKE